MKLFKFGKPMKKQMTDYVSYKIHQRTRKLHTFSKSKIEI